MRAAMLISFSLFWLGCSSSKSSNGEKFEIRMSEDKVGTSGRIEEQIQSSNVTTLTTKNGPQKKSMVKTGQFTYVETILEVNGSEGATKTVRHYEKGSATINGSPVSLSFIGKVVIKEKKGDKTTFTMSGRPLSSADIEWIGSEKNSKKTMDEKHTAILPNGPVAVGEEWDLSPDPYIEEAGKNATFDRNKSTGRGKLVQAERKDGILYGKIEIVITLSVREINVAGGKNVAAAPGSTQIIKIELNGCLDGQVDSGEAKFTSELRLEIPSTPSGTMTIAADSVKSTRETALPSNPTAGKK